MHKNVVQLIHDGGHLFTGLRTSLADVTTILHGTVPANTPTSDVQTIMHLKSGFEYIERVHKPLTLNLVKEINCRVAYDALFPGQFAKQPMGINGIHYQPPKPSESVAKQIIRQCKTEDEPQAIQAIHLMLRFDRRQFFRDGNKRTAWLAANYYLLRHGAGVLNISRHQSGAWNRMLSRFYETSQIDELTRWLKNNCLTSDLGHY